MSLGVTIRWYSVQHIIACLSVWRYMVHCTAHNCMSIIVIQTMVRHIDYHDCALSRSGWLTQWLCYNIAWYRQYQRHYWLKTRVVYGKLLKVSLKTCHSCHIFMQVSIVQMYRITQLSFSSIGCYKKWRCMFKIVCLCYLCFSILIGNI